VRPSAERNQHAKEATQDDANGGDKQHLQKVHAEDNARLAPRL
jgi:hypothetical protein